MFAPGGRLLGTAGFARGAPFLGNECLLGLGQSSDKERKMECSQLRFIAKRL